MKKDRTSEATTLRQKAEELLKKKTSIFRYSAIIAGGMVSIIGIIVLIGWQFENELLKSVIPNAVSMKANTAALFILSGVSLIILQYLNRYSILVVRIFASVIILVGIQSLLQNIFGWDIGLNQILYKEPLGTTGTSYPGLMALYTAINFMLLGLTLLIFSLKTFRYPYLAIFSLIFPLITSTIALVGYFIGYAELAGPVAFTKMAVHTAGAFFILSIGILQLFRQRQQNPIPIEQKLFAGLTISGVVIIYISLFSVSGIQLIQKSTVQVSSDYQTKQMLTKTLSLVVDIETGSRGFIMSGNESLLESMINASVELPVLLNKLNKQIIADRNQLEEFTTLKQLIAERIDFSKQLESTRRTQGLEKAMLLFNTLKGKEITDSIRLVMAKMIAVEDKQLIDSNSNQRTKSSQAQTTIYLSMLSQLILFVIILIALIKNMSSRRKAELILQKSDEFTKRIIACSIDCIKVIDLNGNLLSMSAGGQKLLEIDDLNSFLNKSWVDFWQRDDREAVMNAVLSAKIGNIGSFSAFCPTAKGNPKWWDVIISPIKDALGNIESLLAVSRDITERKQEEEILFKTTEQLEHIGKMARIGGWELDVATTQVTYSRETARIHEVDFPYVPPKLSQGNEFYPPEVWPDVQAKVQAAIEHGTAYDEEWPFITAKGNHIWIRAQGFAIKENGKTIKLQGTFQDITQRKKTEEKLKNAENQLRLLFDEMLSGFAVHEIICDQSGTPTDYRFLSVNKAFEKMTGLDANNILGKTVLNIMPGIESSWIERYGKVALTGEAIQFENYAAALGKHYEVRAFCPQHGTFATLINDITERKQAEQALKKSEDFLIRTGEIARVGGWEMDFDQNKAMWTRTAAEIHELPGTSEIDLDKAFNYFHPDDKQAVRNYVDTAIKAGESFEFEARLVTAKGNERWIRSIGVPVLVSGKCHFISGIVQDITERKLAENELKMAKEKAEESEERFNLAMKASNDGLFDWNLETNDIYYSTAWKKMIGYEDHELANDFSVWEKTTEPEDVKKSWELQQKLISKEIDRFVLEFKMKHKDGHWVDILSRAGAIFNDSGKAIRIVGTHTDITERKQAEEEVKQEQSLRKTIVDSIPGTFYVLDENGLYLSWNAYQRDEIVGKPENLVAETNAADTIHPDDRAIIQSKIANVLINGIDEIVESRVLLRGGPAFRWLVMTGRRIMIKGRPCLVGIGIDITGRKQAEEEIKTKVAELEQFNRLSVGREMRMIELKQKINDLSAQLNLPQPYAMDYLKSTDDITDIGKKDT